MTTETMTCSEMLKYADEVMSEYGTDDLLRVVRKARVLAVEMEGMIKNQAGHPDGRPTSWEIPKGTPHGPSHKPVTAEASPRLPKAHPVAPSR